VKKSNVQGRGIRIKGETVYIVSLASNIDAIFDYLVYRFGKPLCGAHGY